MSAKPSFFAELKRRNVLRAGALYAAAAWALSQGLAQLLPLFGDYNWIARWFVIACIIGFPFWLVFAWVYEFTPAGLKRESEIAPIDSITAHTGRKLDFWIIVILAVAVVLLVTNTFVLHRDDTSTANTVDAKTSAATPAAENSIAVMPFADLSAAQDQALFSAGMAEEILNALTRV
ncbi:MAG: hypothetical protein ABI128_16590, partial [Rhodanobacter sp.]